MLRCVVVLFSFFCFAFSTPAPWFCHGIDCPPYTVVTTTPSYEVRAYPRSYWVSTTVSNISWKSASKIAFRQLFDYISGSNVQHVKVPMTAPVTAIVVPGQGPNCVSNFTFSFFLPLSYQDKPFAQLPQPSGQGVFLREQPALRAGVRAYGGFSGDDDVVTNVAALATDLTKARISFVNGTYFTAGYDSPWTIVNRHNEVWLQIQ